MNITQPTAIAITHSTVNAKCHGSATGIDTAFVTGGATPYSYLWSTSSAQTTHVATGLAAGSYTVTVTDSLDCIATSTVTVGQAAIIALTTSTTSTSTCAATDGSATVSVTSGGTSPFTYSWNSTPNQTTATATGLGAGFYTVTVTDANNCTHDTTVSVKSPSGEVVPVTVNVSCFGGSDGSAKVTMSTGTPPYTYLWSTSPAQTTATATGLAAGSYNIEVTDAAGCKSLGSCVISEPKVISFTKSHKDATCPTCKDGTATAVPSGGTAPYTYTWSTTPAQTTATATGLAAGVYNVCVSDSKGCTKVCDTIVVKAGTSILDLSSNSSNSMIVYPNPTNGQFTVQMKDAESQDMYLRITNLIGEVIYSEKINQKTSYNKTLNLSEYPRGLYQIQIIGGEKNYFGKIILE